MRVCSVEHRDVTVVDSLAVKFVDFVGDELGFVVTRVTGVTNDFFAVAFIAPKVLIWAIKVVANHRIGGLQNVVG